MSSFLSKLFFFKRSNSNRNDYPSTTSSTSKISSPEHKHQPLQSPFSPTFGKSALQKTTSRSIRSSRRNSYRRPLSIVNEQYQEMFEAVYTGPTEKEKTAAAELERARLEVLLGTQVNPPPSSSPPQIALFNEEIVEAERLSGDSSATVSSFSSSTGTNSDLAASSIIRVGGHRVKANHFFADFQLNGFTSKETTVRLFFSRSIVVNCSHKEEDRETGGTEFRTFMKKVMLPPVGTVDLQHAFCKVYPCGLLRVQMPYLQDLVREEEGTCNRKEGTDEEQVQVILTEVTNIRKRSGKCNHH